MPDRRLTDLAVRQDDDVAAAVLALQREAYAVEAALIGSEGIPALTESLEVLRAAGESWLGCIDADGLSGAVAWQLLDDGTVDICRLGPDAAVPPPPNMIAHRPSIVSGR